MSSSTRTSPWEAKDRPVLQAGASVLGAEGSALGAEGSVLGAEGSVLGAEGSVSVAEGSFLRAGVIMMGTPSWKE